MLRTPTSDPTATTPASTVALLLVDLIHNFDFEGSETLVENMRRLVAPCRALRDKARQASVPIIYVNDNFGAWRSSFEETVASCRQGPGADIVAALEPSKEDYFVLKPHRSGFYGTPLDILLHQLQVQRVVLAGVSTDMCILATANDARMRDYDVWIASDATAALDEERHHAALRLMSSSLDATCLPASQIEMGTGALSREPPSPMPTGCR